MDSSFVDQAARLSLLRLHQVSNSGEAARFSPRPGTPGRGERDIRCANQFFALRPSTDPKLNPSVIESKLAASHQRPNGVTQSLGILLVVARKELGKLPTLVITGRAIEE